MRPARVGLTATLAVGAAVAAGVVPALAATHATATGSATAGSSPGVGRHVAETIHIQDTYGTNPGYTHDYTATLNPCTGVFTGTGTSGDGHTESITGTFTGSTLTYSSTYTGPSAGAGLQWQIAPATVGADGSFSTTGTITAPTTASAPVTGTVSVTADTGEHPHGWYVRQDPGERTARSCLGMPVTATQHGASPQAGTATPPAPVPPTPAGATPAPTTAAHSTSASTASTHARDLERAERSDRSGTGLSLDTNDQLEARAGSETTSTSVTVTAGTDTRQR